MEVHSGVWAIGNLGLSWTSSVPKIIMAGIPKQRVYFGGPGWRSPEPPALVSAAASAAEAAGSTSAGRRASRGFRLASKAACRAKQKDHMCICINIYI